jgi:hypothetical protein
LPPFEAEEAEGTRHRARDGRLNAVLVVDLALHDEAVVTRGHGTHGHVVHAIDGEERRPQVGCRRLDLEQDHVRLLHRPLQPRR